MWDNKNRHRWDYMHFLLPHVTKERGYIHCRSAVLLEGSSHIDITKTLVITRQKLYSQKYQQWSVSYRLTKDGNKLGKCLVQGKDTIFSYSIKSTPISGWICSVSPIIVLENWGITTGQLKGRSFQQGQCLASCSLSELPVNVAHVSIR